MCVSINKSGSSFILRKEKLDGNVEVVSFENYMTKSIIHAINCVATTSESTSVKVMKFIIKSFKNSNYVSIKNIKTKETIFIPRHDVGIVLTKLS